MTSHKEADRGWDLSHDQAGNNMGAAADGIKIQTIFITLSDFIQWVSLKPQSPFNNSTFQLGDRNGWVFLSFRDSLVLYLIFSPLTSPKPKTITLVAIYMTCFNSACNHFTVRLALIMACACHNRVGSQKSKWQLDTVSAMHRLGISLQIWLIVHW